MNRSMTQDLIQMRYTDAQIEVMQAFVDGKTIELRRLNENEWHEAVDPAWRFANNEYRVKVKTLGIPWAALKPEWQWAAMDPNGSIYVFDKEPRKGCSVWRCADAHSDYKPLNTTLLEVDSKGVEWQASLTKRPT